MDLVRRSAAKTGEDPERAIAWAEMSCCGEQNDRRNLLRSWALRVEKGSTDVKLEEMIR